MYSKLLATITTKDDQGRFLDQLAEFKQILFKEKQSVSESIDSIFDSKTASLLRELLLRKERTPVQLIDELVETVRVLPMINLTLARDLPKQMLSSIHDSLLKSIGSPVLIKIAIDPGIVAGALIEYQGKFYDGSLKEKVQKELEVFKSRF